MMRPKYNAFNFCDELDLAQSKYLNRALEGEDQLDSVDWRVTFSNIIYITDSVEMGWSLVLLQ